MYLRLSKYIYIYHYILLHMYPSSKCLHAGCFPNLKANHLKIHAELRTSLGNRCCFNPYLVGKRT